MTEKEYSANFSEADDAEVLAYIIQEFIATCHRYAISKGYEDEDETSDDDDDGDTPDSTLTATSVVAEIGSK